MRRKRNLLQGLRPAPPPPADFCRTSGSLDNSVEVCLSLPDETVGVRVRAMQPFGAAGTFYAPDSEAILPQRHAQELIAAGAAMAIGGIASMMQPEAIDIVREGWGVWYFQESRTLNSNIVRAIGGQPFNVAGREEITCSFRIANRDEIDLLLAPINAGTPVYLEGRRWRVNMVSYESGPNGGHYQFECSAIIDI